MRTVALAYMRRLTMRETVMAALCACVLTGCGASRVALSTELIREHGLSADDLKQLHYYVSREIVLSRKQTDTQSGRDEHGLSVIRDRKIDEIRLAPDTPGIAEEVGEGERMLRISFEKGGNFTFRLEDLGASSVPDAQLPRFHGYYSLAPDGIDEDTQLPYFNYRGRKYFIRRGAGAVLEVERKAVSKERRKSRAIGGRKLK